MERLSTKPNKHRKRLRRLAKWIWLYPPYLGAGISVKEVSNDAQTYIVQLKQRWFNRNMYGSHFGGSLYSMVDPFFVFVAAAYFGEGYILWDKRAKIEYIRPGRGTVYVKVHIPSTDLAEMKSVIDKEGKGTFDFTTEILDQSSSVVASVEKTIYIRKA